MAFAILFLQLTPIQNNVQNAKMSYFARNAQSNLMENVVIASLIAFNLLKLAHNYNRLFQIYQSNVIILKSDAPKFLEDINLMCKYTKT